MTSTRRALPLLLAGALAASALLWVLIFGAPTSEDRSSAVVSDRSGLSMRPAQSSGDPVALAAPALAPGTATERTELALDPSATPSPAVIRAALDQPQVVARVVDLSGSPIEGAAASFTTRRSELPLGYELDATSMADVARDQSDEAGRVEIASDDATPRLRAGRPLEGLIRAPGRAAHRLGGRDMPSALPFDLGDVVLEPGAVCEGRVLLPIGDPAAGVSLYFGQKSAQGTITRVTPSRGLPFAVTGDDGAFRCDELVAGDFWILADAPDHPIASFEGTARLGAPLLGATIRLRPGASVAGRIDGMPAGKKLVVEARHTEAEDEGPEHGRPRFANVEPTDGTFTVRGLLKGRRVRLRVRELATDGAALADASEALEGLAGDRVREVRSVEVMAGATEVVMEWRARRSIAGRVLAPRQPGGDPVPLESFLISVAGGSPEGTEFDAQPMREGGEPLREHPGGRFHWSALPLRGDTKEATFRVRAPGYDDLVVRSVAVPRREHVDVGDWILQPAPSLSITVRDVDTGAPLEGARLYLVSAANDRWFQRWYGRDEPSWASDTVRFGETAEEGIAQLPLPAGGLPWRLGVRADGFVSPEPLTIVSGVDPVEVEIGRGASVAVRVRDSENEPVAGMEVRVDPPRNRRGEPIGGKRAYSGRTGSDGVLRFDAVPTGEYTVGAVPPGFQSGRRGRGPDYPIDWPDEVVEVPAMGEVDVELLVSAIEDVVGSVTEAGLALPDARLEFCVRVGDELKEPSWGTTELRTVSDGNGVFTARDVPVGAYVVAITHPERASVSLFDIEVQKSRAEDSRDRFVFDLPTGTLRGTVRLRADADGGEGAPMEGVRVRLRPPSGYPGAWVGQRSIVERENGEMRAENDFRRPSETRTDAGGRFELRGVEPGVAFSLSAEDGLIRPTRIDVPPLVGGEVSAEVVLLVDGAARIRVEVERVGDAEVRSRRNPPRTAVQLTRFDSKGRARQTQVQNARRSANFQSLRPGKYRIRTFAPGVEPSDGTPVAEQEVEVGAFDELTLRMRGD